MSLSPENKALIGRELGGFAVACAVQSGISLKSAELNCLLDAARLEGLAQARYAQYRDEVSRMRDDGTIAPPSKAGGAE